MAHESIGVIQNTPNIDQGKLITAQKLLIDTNQDVAYPDSPFKEIGLRITPASGPRDVERTNQILDLKALINKSPDKKF